MNDQHGVPLDLRIYPLPAIESAIYAFGAGMITPVNETEVKVHFIGVVEGSDELAQRFLIQLHDFVLRHRINNETKSIKETIIRVALTEASGGA